MPLGGGETVGHVWVKVHADGTGLDKEVKDEFDDLGPTYNKAGENSSKEFNKGWMTEFEKGLAETQKKFAADQKKMINQNRGFRSQLTKTTKEISKWVDGFEDTNRALQHSKELLAEVARNEDAIRTRLTLPDFGEKWKKFRTDASKAFNVVATNAKLWAALTNRRLDSVSNRSRTLARALDDVAEVTGKRFGKDGRNNFVNFMGLAVQGSIKLVALFPKVVAGLSDVAKFGLGGGGGGMESFSKFASAAAASLAGIAIAIVAITVVAAPLAAALSGLAAALVALTSVAVFAAAAVGGVALALGATLAASVGVAILAFKNLDSQTKKSFDGLKDRFKNLGDSAGQAIGPGLRRAAGILDKAFANPRIEKLIDGIAEALGGVAVEFAKVTEGAPFRKFVNSMTVFLPNAIGKLGEITANFGEAFMGILRALEPITNRFLNWLVDVSQRFADWTNSVAGQEALKNFFDRAADSASALGGLIADAAKAIGGLLSAGNESGNTIVQDLRNQLQRFINYLQNPKNRKSIRDFFQNGIEVARAFGRALQAAGRLFDALDGPRSRAAFQFIMNALGKLFDFWAAGVRTWSRIGGSIITFWSKFRSAAKTATDKVIEFGQGVIDFFKDLPGEIVDAFSGLGQKIKDAIGSIKLSDLIIFPAGKLGSALRDKFTASGGVFTGAQSRIIGEAGPEAVVPLNRPLNQVDPSVRALSAIAQGLAVPGSVSTNGGGGITINVTTPASDARAVALETMNYLAAQGY